MADDLHLDIIRQVTRVRRRLFVRDLLQHVTIATAVVLIGATVWLLCEPYLPNKLQASTKWGLLAGSAVLAWLLSAILAWRNRPDQTRSALWLDEAFGLRERTVTALSLGHELRTTPAGQAVLEDALRCARGVRVADRFPISLDRTAWLVPSTAAVLALVALFYEPAVVGPVQAQTGENKPIAASDKAELEKRMAAIQKPKPADRPDRAKSDELKQLEAKLDEIAKRPRDTTKQLAERIKELTPLEDEMKRLDRDRSERARMLQQQLRAKGSLDGNEMSKTGPAKDFQKALSEGDLDKARDELDKLAKKMKDGALTKKDEEQLAKQLEGLQKKMEELAKQKDKQEQLKQLAKEGKLDPEALERELQQLRKDNEKLKDLQKLANQLGQCQQCMKAGDAAGARAALSDAAKELDRMSQDSQELSELREQLDNLREAKDGICKACQGDGEGMQKSDLDGEMLQSQLNRGGDGLGAAERGSGRRPEGAQGKIRSIDARQNGQFNSKGQKVFDGFVPGQAFKKKSGLDMAGDIKAAAQEAPEAIETQRIPKAARDMAKGYFKNLGNQAGGEKAKEAKK